MIYPGKYILTLILIVSSQLAFSQKKIRQDIPLDLNWETIANDSDSSAYRGFESPGYVTTGWESVDIPHNWDKYEGYRRLVHGNRHGYAWYRKKFSLPADDHEKKYFLWFEGVGSYATVYLNGTYVGYHAGGRTSFMLDITPYIQSGKHENILAVRADHPAYIRDLPWVCGGCSPEWGFSEGSQPMGIFRSVHLIITGKILIEPFGVHIWNDTTISDKSAELYVETEVKNYDSKPQKISLISRLKDKNGIIIAESETTDKLPEGEIRILKNPSLKVNHPLLWSLDNPYLYTLESELRIQGKTVDATTIKYGIRWISWPIGQENSTGQFLLNGKPVFINGTAEYEHMMGKSHAFSKDQIKARVEQIRAAGFNAFRDAHQPHNLYYQEFWDSLGMLFWPQFAAHIWFDTPGFKSNFKQLLTDWVKERRNCPSVILWGLENESSLPEPFARECADIIRRLDPTASIQRKITTCNGGTGTDWNVIQNWSGTYAGDLFKYDEDQKNELLNGEYGAWRSIDLHSEGEFAEGGINSENRMCQVLETKIRLAEQAKDSSCGQFQWIFNSHENPGRTQNGEGYREMDRIGPVNYKGLFTAWGEPLDAYYLFRSNYAPKETEPMVYIVSHSWPDRWTQPGIKDNIIAYSNCDEVELFNDVNSVSLGKRSYNGIGNHFRWDSVNLRYNVIYAIGYVQKKAVASDVIVLHHLPEAPHLKNLYPSDDHVLLPDSDYTYLYRINCGGPEYTDRFGNIWLADRHKTDSLSWGSLSWTDEFSGLPPYYASQRRTFDPIGGTQDWKLFQTFRYGRDKLSYEFPVEKGEYLVVLYFIEPWYGTGGGLDCTGWRKFDVAVNGNTLIKDLDIWKEYGHDQLIKKNIYTSIGEGKLVISFPKVSSDQAVISAIAIAAKGKGLQKKIPQNSFIRDFNMDTIPDIKKWSIRAWLDTGEKQYSDDDVTFTSLPPNLYGAEWICTPKFFTGKYSTAFASFSLRIEADVFIALNIKIDSVPVWMKDYTPTKTFIENDDSSDNKFLLYCKRYAADSLVRLGINGKSSGAVPKMYTTFIVPVSSLGQAVDQRPQIKYPAVLAKRIGDGLILKEDKGVEYVSFSKNTADTLEWEIQVGIGDSYTLQFRYLNNSDDAIPMSLTIHDINKNLIHS